MTAIRISVNLSGARDGDGRRLIEAAQRLGVDGVELETAQGAFQPENLGETARRDLAHALANAHLSAAAVHVDFHPGLAALASADRNLARLEICAKLAYDVGSPTLCGDVGSIPDEKNSEAFRAFFSEAAERIQRWGMGLALRATGPNIARWVDALPGLDGLVTAMLDPGACSAIGLDPVGLIPKLGVRLGHVLATDVSSGGTVVPAGRGMLAWDDLWIALHAVGYRGFVGLRAAQSSDLAATLNHLRSL